MTIRPSDIKPVRNYIGRSQYVSDARFKGYIDDFCVYNHALSSEDVKKLYNGESPWDILRGDVNGDGVVNGTDIQAVINFIVAGEYDEKADVNRDGIVNGTDIQEIINIIVNAD
jgi:hypothetical protein